MEIFYIEIILLLFIGIIEFNPKRLYYAEKQKSNDNISRVIFPLMYITLIIFFIINRIIYRILPGLTFEMLGLTFLIFGLIIRIKSMQDLKENFSYAISIPNRIHNKGIYRHIRHPAYIGSFCYGLGIFLFSPSLLSLIIFIVIIFIIIYRIKLEENLLLKIGNDFKKYKKETPSFFPKLQLFFRH